MKTGAIAVIVLSAFVADGASAQTMYKCMQDGKVAYQAQPCPVAATQDKLKLRDTGPGATPAELDRMIDFMSTYRACADAIRVWGEEMAKPYEEWRSRNLAAVTRIENDRQLTARYQQSVDAKRTAKAGICREVALELRGKKS